MFFMLQQPQSNQSLNAYFHLELNIVYEFQIRLNTYFNITNTLVCSEPPKLENGHYTGPNVPTNGSTYKYECNQGYYINQNSSDLLKCLENGTYEWNKGYPPVCLKISEF